MVTKFAVISQHKRHCRELDLITRDSNSIQYQKHLQLPAVGDIYIYIYTYMYALSFLYPIFLDFCSNYSPGIDKQRTKYFQV